MIKCKFTRNKPFVNLVKSKLSRIDNMCEVGVNRGSSAMFTLKHLKPGQLYLIDPYILYEGYTFNALTQQDFDSNKVFFKNRIKKYSNVHLIERSSMDVLEEFEDNYFDVIWLDGNHSYEYLCKEIPLAWSKTKYILGGHDYCAGTPGVAKAVNEFAEHKGLFDELDGMCTNWLIVKKIN